ncbi:MAG TPA: hypothetical protein VFQ05_15685 [Candidatus Eisenbacteria bacterium]|nr:hypothetical protein [Candidatus Eisenbacteria bacterium]
MKNKLWTLTYQVVLGLSALGAAGCSKSVDTVFRDNLPPEVRLTQAPIRASSSDPYFYAYRMNWVGYDPDGRVDHFVISVDPPRPDSVELALKNDQGLPIWSPTNKNEEIIFFRATTPESAASDYLNATDFHTFAIAAVDDKGALSTPVWRTFFSYTVAPQVFIESPSPNSVFTPIVTPVVRIAWRGIDPDGQFTAKPVKYRYRLFGKKNPDFPEIEDFVAHVWSEPRFLRWMYAPTFGPSEKCPTCTVWDSSSADTTEVQYTNLVPDQLYLFAVTGFDEAGAYDPNFVRGSNVLRFAVTYAGTLGPQICMGNEFFNYCYDTGGYANDPSRYVNVEVPEGQQFCIYWFAIPPEGANIRRYRWVLDLQDLTDETPRTDELKDWYHWSAYSLNTITACVGPFDIEPSPDHLFFIEAEDNNGLRSLGIVRFTVVRATLDKPLLFVDDTRLSPDAKSPTTNTYEPPRGTWPTSAELDTFFFARGGYPWRGYPGSPDGLPAPTPTLSTPGIFNGYPFDPQDTLTTRGILSGIVPLARLGRYKVVIWYTDDTGATYTGSPLELFAPTTSLRFMSQPGQPSTISTYLKQGGKVWMFGGGAVYATMINWGRRNTPPNDWTNIDLELVPGRFMFDFAHWQSSVAIAPARQALINTPDWSPPEWGSTYSIGRNWSGHGMDADLGMPNYGRLVNNPRVSMSVLSPRTCLSDPPPSQRFCNSFYLVSSYPAEYIGRVAGQSSPPNFIWEDMDQDPNVFREESTLDTLYAAIGGSMPAQLPVMTYYHGRQTPQMVFSGFPLWYFQRRQVIELVDFVMQEIFGFPPPPAGARGLNGPVPARAVSAAGTTTATPIAKSRTAAAPLRR